MATTWDPAHKNASIALTGSNLIATSSAGSGSVNCGVIATTPISGLVKQYFEVTFSSSASAQYFSVGVMNGNASLSANIAATNGAAWVNKLSSVTVSQLYRNGTATSSYSVVLSNSQVVRVAVDRLNNKLWVAINNNTWSGSAVWMGSGGTTDDPASGTGGLDITGVTGAIYPAFSSAWTGDVATLNPGPAGLAYAVPTGFVAIDNVGPTLAVATQIGVEQWASTAVVAGSRYAAMTQIGLEQWAAAPVTPSGSAQAMAMILA